MAKYALYQDKEKSNRFDLGGMGNFLLIWFGQIVSMMGSGMTCFAQNVWVYTDWGERITHLTALAVLAQLPGLIVSPIAGVVVDRLNRRWVMIICDTVAAAATLTLRTLIVTDTIQIWHIYLIVVVISIANHFQWPAYFASVSLMLPKRHLGTANGLLQMGRALGQTAAPFLAGVAVTLFKIQGVILFDMATYLFAMVTLLIVRIPQLPTAPVTGEKVQVSLWQDAVYGWKYLVSRRGLMGLMVLFAVGNFLMGIAGILVMPLVLSITSAAMLGTVLSIGGISMLFGSLVMTAWGGPKRWVYGVLGFTLVQGVAIMVAGVSPSLFPIFAGAILFYFAAPIVNACGGAIWQAKVDPRVQGRAIAASSMMSAAGLELGYLSAGPLADYVFEPLMAEGGGLAATVGRLIGAGQGRGIALMFVLFGALCVVTTVVATLNPHIRNVEKELPDVGPGSDGEGQVQWPATAPIYSGDVG